MDAVKNFAKVDVTAGGYSDTATEIVVATGGGSKLPDPATDGEFNLVWWDSTSFPDPADDPNVEIVRVTARTTDTLTITRGQEDTGASTKSTADSEYKMILSLTSKTIDDIGVDIAAGAVETVTSYVAPTTAELVGGTDVSSIATLNAVSGGTFELTIDGAETEIGTDETETINETAIDKTLTRDGSRGAYYDDRTGVVFTVPAGMTSIISITPSLRWLNKDDYPFLSELRTVTGNVPTSTVLTSKSQAHVESAGVDFDSEVVWASEQAVTAGDRLAFTIGVTATTSSDYQIQLNYSTSTIDGFNTCHSFDNSSWTSDLTQCAIFKVKGKTKSGKIYTVDCSTNDDIATEIERVVNLSTDRVASITYDTDHFKITADDDVTEVSALTAAATGTNLSELLDLGTGATVSAATTSPTGQAPVTVAGGKVPATLIDGAIEYEDKTPGKIIGGLDIASAATLQAVTDGAFKVDIDGTETEITGVNLSGRREITSLSGTLTASQSGAAGIDYGRGFCIRGNGTRMYGTGSSYTKIYQYDFTTPYDISTLTKVGEFTIPSGTSDDQCMTIDQSGAHIFIAFKDTGQKYIKHFELTTPWDVTTMVYRSQYYTNSLYMYGAMAVSPDGTILTYRDYDDQKTITMATPWDLSTASATKTQDLMGRQSQITFTSNGYRAFVHNSNQSRLYQFELTTPYVIEQNFGAQAYGTLPTSTYSSVVENDKIFYLQNYSNIHKVNYGNSSAIDLDMEIDVADVVAASIGESVIYTYGRLEVEGEELTDKELSAFSAPASGTDISELLDLGSGATVVLPSTGSRGKAIVTDETTGKVRGGLVSCEMGVLNITDAGTYTVTPGFRVSEVELHASAWNNVDNAVTRSFGFSKGDTHQCAYNYVNAGSTINTSWAFLAGVSSSAYYAGKVTNITATTFDIEVTKVGAPNTTSIFWKA